MGETLENLPTKRASWWSPFRLFEWIDRQPSESRRRITQSLFSSLGFTIVVSVVGIIWTHKAALADFPKWTFAFLQSPVQLQLWILLLALVGLFGAAWFFYWVRRKNKRIAELESALKKLKPHTSDEILNGLYQQLETKRRQLLTKIVDLVKSENQPNLKYDPIGALIKYSDEMDSENDVIWICNELVKHSYKHPFETLERASDNALSGKWLKVLREARLNSVELRKETQLLEFLVLKWSERGAWVAAKNKHNIQVQNDHPVSVEFVGEYSLKIPHKCSLCGFTYMIQNPIFVSSGNTNERPFVTCPQKLCGQIDFLR